MTEFSKALDKLIKKKELSLEEAFEVASSALKGELSEAQISALLVALRAKGESPSEIAGFALAMRSLSLRVGPWKEALDTAGTGGDGLNTFNASTASAIILSAQVKVAKHGNRGVSSKNGSADFLEALGYDIFVKPEEAERLLQGSGFVFLFAQLYHPLMKNVAPIRRALGIPTIFNVLGPLTNPAGVERQVIGVYSPSLLLPIAQAISLMGAKSAYLVHGHPGMDEVSVSGNTEIIKINRKGYERFVITLEELKVKDPISVEKLKVSGPEDSALRFLKALKGKDPDIRTFIKANTAVALLASESASSLSDALDLAEHLILNGYQTLVKVVTSHGTFDKISALEAKIA